MSKKYNRYNCMGHALHDKRWLLLGSDYEDGPKWLEQEYNLKPVRKKDLVLGKSYIAFRYGPSDFHFVRRCPKGHWSHKIGGYPAKAISEKEVFGKYWATPWNLYNSKLFLYEVQS